MADADQPKGRARGRGRGQSPPPPGDGSRRPLPPGAQHPGMGPAQPMQQGMRPTQHMQHGMRPAQHMQQGMRPAQHMQQGMRPAQHMQQGMRPAQPMQQGMRPAQPMQQGMRPARPMQQGMRPTRHMQPVSAWQKPSQADTQRPDMQSLLPAGGYPQQSPQIQTVPPSIRQPDSTMMRARPPVPDSVRTTPRPMQPGQSGQPRMTAAVDKTTRPDTSQSRAYYRGLERSQSSSSHTGGQQEQALAQDMARVAIDSASGNGSNGNGANGGSAVPVGRGMSRGGRTLEGKLPILRPHRNSKIGSASRANVKLQVNYFELQRREEWRLHQYDVQYSPPQDDKKMRYKLMEPHLKHFEGNVFDGAAIFSAIRLTEKVTKFTSREDVDYVITVTHIKELDGLDEQFMRFLNLILRRCQNHINLKLIGRHYFNTGESKALDAQLKMRVFPGYQTSIRQHEEKILLNVDIVHKFQQEVTLLDKLQTISLEQQQELVGTIVMAKYNHLTYRVDGIRTDLSPLSTFNYRGDRVTYKDYYANKYQIQIRQPNQPLAYSKPTTRQLRSGIEEIFLVPELMTMTGIPDDLRRNYNKMKLLADYTKMGVDRRVEALKRFNRQLLSSDKVREDLAKWGLTLAPNLVTVDARVLPYEAVLLDRDEPTQHPPDSADWGAQFRNKRMANIVHLKNWAVLCSRRCADDVANFISSVQQAGRSVGMNIAQPEVVIVNGLREVENEITKYSGVQMIMIVMDNLLSSKYGNLKRSLACHHGVLSQCVLGNTIRKKGLMSIATKIAIQMNAKMGGEPWCINQPARTAMVVGYDVYHDSNSRGKSFGAVVSSINERCTRYYGQVNPHHNQEELSDNFSSSIRSAVECYHRSNNEKYPSTLIVYRDGVGEGQIDYVKEHEIPAIKRQLKEIGSIALIFIVVTKRINTRMFADHNGRLSNPVPGTVMDRTVTLPQWYDFFLVSQKVTQGTVTPTAYNVLEDTTKLTVDQVQRLTYKFTHLYFNWQGTVRVPAPCLYAHKLAYMSGTGTHELPKPRLNDKLWFI